ncbi:MAG TPA: FAD-binding oxidoreductase [Propionibacteriaceae bacterium]|nr:FAD-binding oxidoreductase [Propionibacteriaceae bacterium]
MPATTNSSTSLSIPRLRSRLNGRVIGPDDASYDRARTVFYGGFDRRPAVIVRAADAADVAYVVSLARETGLDLSVRSGAHSPAGYGVNEGGIVLDMSDLRKLDIDAESGTAWVGSGLTAGEYTTAAAAHGLATGFGDTGSVGIGGITLAGGVGYLSRKYGLTIDQLLAAEVVTADGHLIRADEENNADLFWALRGGGGNFGIVTRFQFQLHELPTIVGGLLVLPATAESIEEFVARAQEAPDELSSIANVMPAPPMPFLPPERHGELVILATMAYAGSVEAGLQAVAPFRALGTPLADMVQPMPYPQIYPPEPEDFHPLAKARTMFVDGVDQRVSNLILDRLQASTAMMSAAQIRVLGGAVAAVPAEATAFAHRKQPMLVNVAAIYGESDDPATHEAWVADFTAALRPVGGAYVGFLADEGPERVREAYPGPTWDKLCAIKASYDPDNLFHLNQNIPPAVAGGDGISSED